MSESSVACLVRIKNGDHVRAHIIMRPQFIIGRSKEADVPYVSSTASRQHLRVDLNKDSVTVTDLKSNNGTFLDGVQLQPNKSIIVQGNNIVRIGSGKEEFTFQIIPVPMEMMNNDMQKETLLRNMTTVRDEAEKIGRNALVEERKAFQAQLNLEKEQMLLAFEKESDERKKALEHHCRELLDGAKKKADEMISKAKEQSDSYQAQSLHSVLEKKKDLEFKVAILQEDARKLAEHTKSKAQAEAEKIISAGKLEAKKEIDSAIRSSESITAEAQVKAAEKAKSADKEVALLLQKAKSEMETMRHNSALEAKIKLEEAQHRADRVLAEAKTVADAEVAEHKKSAVSAIRTATLQEQENIIKEYRSSIEKLHDSKEQLESEFSQLTSDIKGYKSEKVALGKESEILQAAVVEERHLLSQVQDELEKAQKLIARSEEAAVELKKAKEEKEVMKQKYQKYKSDYERGIRNMEDELKAMKEKTLLEFQAFRKNQEEEMAKSRLDSLEKLKTTIQDEELKYRQTLEFRAVEISRSIESRLLPNLEAHLKAKGLSTSLGGVLDHIQIAVNEVVLKEKPSIKAVTEHLGIDPEKVLKAKQRNRKMAYALAATAALAVAAFGEPVYQYLKESRSTYSEYLIAKRSAESIYTPVQNSDWKETYTGNILYLKNYYEAKTDPIYEDQWALKLNNLEFLRSLKLNEDDIIKFIGKEATLVRQLYDLRENIDARYLDEGLGKMNEMEIQTIAEMKEILKGDEHFESIRSLEKDFTQQFLRKKFGKSSIRQPTQSDE